MPDPDQSIFYFDEAISKQLELNFEKAGDSAWVELYQSKIDGTFWRLNKWDKYQTQYFVKVDSQDTWIEFDSVALERIY